MIDYFFWGTIILISFTVLVWIIIFSLIYYWRQNNISPLIVPLLFAFEFFMIFFLVFLAVSLIINYLPGIANSF